MPITRQQRFEALAGEVAEPVLRFALRRTDPQTAEDVLSETLLVAWRRLDDIPAGAELPSCYVVARNHLANAARSERRRNNLLTRIIRLDPFIAGAELPADVPDPAVHRALARLPVEQQELLRLSAWEELTAPEIAVVLGISANAVHIRLHRARQRLADFMADEDGKGGRDGGQRQDGRGGRHE